MKISAAALALGPTTSCFTTQTLTAFSKTGDRIQGVD
jgi:hypothetical protein